MSINILLTVVRPDSWPARHTPRCRAGLREARLLRERGDLLLRADNAPVKRSLSVLSRGPKRNLRRTICSRGSDCAWRRSSRPAPEAPEAMGCPPLSRYANWRRKLSTADGNMKFAGASPAVYSRFACGWYSKTSR